MIRRQRDGRPRLIKLKGHWGLNRLRHRHGFGIHSPFGYQLVKNALYLSSKYRFYGETELEARPEKRAVRRRLRALLRVAAYMGVESICTSSPASEGLREVCRLGGIDLKEGEPDDARMMVDFEGHFSLEQAGEFLETPWRIVWQHTPEGVSAEDLPGDLIIAFRDSYLAFSRPGMARNLYKM